MSTNLDVLIIDDEAEFALLVREVAEGLNLKTEIATDANQFRSVFENRLPRIVVLDLFMPGVNGFELSQWMGQIIRTNNFNCRLLIVSGHSDQHIRMCRTVAALAGIEDILTFSKPLEITSLEQALRI